MSDVADKWGTPVAERGFAQVPNYLLLLNQFLDQDHRLAPAELLVLIQLVGSWWRKDALPFPSMGTLATRCGVSSRQIQRAINRLESLGLISRVKRRAHGIIASNAYDLGPLAAVLGEIAKAFPNEFPRNVDRATAARISGQLATARRDTLAASTSPAGVTSAVIAEVDFDTPGLKT
jgi:predicted transcriptional regulator